MYSLGCPFVRLSSASACVEWRCCLNFLTGGTSPFKEDLRFNDACSGSAGMFSFKFANTR